MGGWALPCAWKGMGIPLGFSERERGRRFRVDRAEPDLPDRPLCRRRDPAGCVGLRC